MKSKVLIAVPYHEKKRYCLQQLYSSLEAISEQARLSGIDVEVLVRHDLNEFGKKDNVKKQREFFRLHALSNEFSHIFFHGADTIPPVSVIERLLALNVNIASGVYWQRGKEKALNAIAWLADESGTPVDTAVKNELLAKEDEVFPAAGFGLDCVLIDVDALRQISWMDWGVNDDDYPFCERANEYGLSMMIDSSVQCKHWDTEKSYSFLGEYFEV